MTYFLWNMVYTQNSMAFGFSKEQMMTYVFMVLIFMSFVVAAPSIENIGNEISNETYNFLVKPINYLKYWLVRDWASKLLNTIFVFLKSVYYGLFLNLNLFYPKHCFWFYQYFGFDIGCFDLLFIYKTSCIHCILGS